MMVEISVSNAASSGTGSPVTGKVSTGSVGVLSWSEATE